MYYSLDDYKKTNLLLDDAVKILQTHYLDKHTISSWMKILDMYDEIGERPKAAYIMRYFTSHIDGAIMCNTKFIDKSLVYSTLEKLITKARTW